MPLDLRVQSMELVGSTPLFAARGPPRSLERELFDLKSGAGLDEIARSRTSVGGICFLSAPNRTGKIASKNGVSGARW